MVETPDFHKDKTFIETKKRIERKTEYANGLALYSKALRTRYFINNKAAADELLNILQQKKEVKNPVSTPLHH